MRVAVAGASAAGTMTALLLARSGHDVTLLDADVLDVEDNVEAAATSCFRQAAPQVVQPHAALPRFRELLRQHLPDVLADLLRAGAVEAPLPAQMPPTLADREPRPGDERITLLLFRRSTLDWVLRRTVAAQPGITIRPGVRVRGLLARPGRPPHVQGVRTEAGEVSADLVVDATGRRSHVDAWLDAIGAAPPLLESAECGLAYYARHYRVRSGRVPPGPPTTRVLLALDQLTAGLWCSDNGSILIALAPLVADKRFTAARDPHVHDAVLRVIPQLALWREALEPTGPVHPMGGLHNTLRQLVHEGAPVVTGFATVGDSVCTTNPTFGRGLALALIGAADLATALDSQAGEPLDLAERLADGIREQIRPFYVDQARNDAARLAQLRHNLFGDPVTTPDAEAGRVTFGELRAAMGFDPTVFRAFWQVMGALQAPEEVYTDPDVVKHTRAALPLANAQTVVQTDPAALSAALALNGASAKGIARIGQSST